MNPKTRHMEADQHKRMALIVGAGAVKHSWEPVLRALQPHFDFPLSPDGANCFLARLVYLLRWYSSDTTEVGKEALDAGKQFLNDIRASICRELHVAQANDELMVRAEFSDIIDSFIVRKNRAVTLMLVTTNWDTVVPDALAQYLHRTMDGEIVPLHIHGSIANEDTLYLPTEMTKEPYRSPMEEKSIGGVHGSVWRGLESAEQVVVYGLSLSPLDAELGQILAAGYNNAYLKEISIICPDHALVAHRTNLLFLEADRTIAVRGYDPQDLSKASDYSVRRE